jgi:putative ABC transport system permease protein
MRQLLTESLLLSVGGGALGVLVAYGGLAALKATMPGGMLPPNVQVEMDARVLLFVLGLSLLTGVLFGVVPAFKATRGDLAESIKEGALGMSSGSSSHVFRGTLVVSEVALAFVLLAGAGLLIRSFLQMQVVETGFDSTGVVTAYLPISPKRFHTAEELKAYLHRITDAVGSVAGVRDVAVTSALPLRGWGYGMPFQVVGAKDVDVANRPDCFFKMVGPSYFRALGIRLVKGRSLNEHDVKGSPPVTVINETMAKKFFPDKNPIGERIRIEEIAYGETKLGPEIPWEIVGVIADEKVGYLGGSNDDSPGVYVTYEQSPQTGQALVVRGATESPLLQKSIRNAIHEVNKDQIVDDMETLEQIKHESVGYDRFRSALMGIFAGIALVLAAMGLYGVISYSVLQRTREIGIRSVLGASPGNILRLVLRNGLTLTATGLVIGIGASFVLAQFLSSMLFNVGKYDPATFSAVAGLMLLIAAAACLIPARRAMRVDPIVALRYE